MSAKKIEVDARAVNGFFRDLGRLTGRSQREVIRAEAVKIVEKAISGTKAAKAKAIQDSHTAFPKGKRKWTQRDGKLYKLTHRYKDSLWNNLETDLQERKKALLARRGLSKKGFLVMAKAAGLQVKAAGFVIKAEGFDLSKVTAGYEETAGKSYVLTLQNDSTTNEHSGAVRAFQAGVAGRLKFFQTNLKKGVFKDVSATAKKYPGLATRG